MKTKELEGKTMFDAEAAFKAIQEQQQKDFSIFKAARVLPQLKAEVAAKAKSTLAQLKATVLRWFNLRETKDLSQWAKKAGVALDLRKRETWEKLLGSKAADTLQLFILKAKRQGTQAAHAAAQAKFAGSKQINKLVEPSAPVREFVKGDVVKVLFNGEVKVGRVHFLAPAQHSAVVWLPGNLQVMFNFNEMTLVLLAVGAKSSTAIAAVA